MKSNRRKHIKLKKALSAVLTLVLILSSVSITAFAETNNCDYTIVLKNGAAYKNSTSGDNITSTVADMGLTYTDGVWTMNNFNFSTSACVGVQIESETVIALSGANTITVKAPGNDGAHAFGICFQTQTETLTIGGTGTLHLSVTANGDESHALGVARKDFGRGYLIVQDSAAIEVNVINKDKSFFAYGLFAGVTVKNTAEIRITAKCTDSASTYVRAVVNNTVHDAAATDTASGTLLTWTSSENTYFNGSNAATSVTLKAAGYALNSAASGLPDGIIGGVSFTTDGKAANVAKKDVIVTAAAMAVEGYSATLSVSANVTDFDASKGTFTMPDSAVTVTATYSPAAYSITNGAPKANEATNNGYITVSAESAEEGTEITVTAIPNEGYKVDSLTATYNDGTQDQNLTIANGKFSMPGYAVTVDAVFSEIKTKGEDIDLDLEESTDKIPVSTTVDQYYTKTTASDTVYNHRIGVQWWTDAYQTLEHNNLVIQVKEAVKWDPNSLSWIKDADLNGKASVKEGTDKVNFKLSNYSAKAFTCSISYAANTEDTYADKTANTVTFDANNGTQLAKVENSINTLEKTNEAYLDKDGNVDLTKVPTLTITGTVGVDLDSLKDASETSSAVKYGVFTITCTAVSN